MGIHEAGVCAEPFNRGEVLGAILPCIFGSNGRNGEHNTSRAGSENSGIPGSGDRRSLSIKRWTDTDMRPRGKPTRLERHRLKFINNNRIGELLRLCDLEPEEKKLVQSEVVQDARVAGIDFSQDGDEFKFDKVYLEVLTEWGVMCPHPVSSIEKSHSSRAVKCGVCGCLLIGDAEYVKKANP